MPWTSVPSTDPLFLKIEAVDPQTGGVQLTRVSGYGKNQYQYLKCRETNFLAYRNGTGDRLRVWSGVPVETHLKASGCETIPVLGGKSVEYTCNSVQQPATSKYRFTLTDNPSEGGSFVDEADLEKKLMQISTNDGSGPVYFPPNGTMRVLGAGDRVNRLGPSDSLLQVSDLCPIHTTRKENVIYRIPESHEVMIPLDVPAGSQNKTSVIGSRMVPESEVLSAAAEQTGGTMFFTLSPSSSKSLTQVVISDAWTDLPLDTGEWLRVRRKENTSLCHVQHTMPKGNYEEIFFNDFYTSPGRTMTLEGHECFDLAHHRPRGSTSTTGGGQDGATYAPSPVRPTTTITLHLFDLDKRE